jgi:hypothetical protein
MLGIESARSHSSSYGESVSSSQAAEDSAASSFGVGSSAATSSSIGGSQAQSKSGIFGADVFSKLFGDASNVAAQIATGGLTDTANSLFDSGQGFLSSLATLSNPVDGTGEQYLAGRITGEGSELDAQIAGLESDLGRFFGETLLPQIQGDAIAAGQLGGGRQGVAQGAAMQTVGREFQTGVTNLRTSELAARMAAATSLAGIQTTKAGVAAGAAGTGLASLAAQYGLADAGAMASLSPYMALASILGGPAVLTDSEASSFDVSASDASSSDVSGSQSTSTSRASSDSRSFESSTSKSKSAGFSLGS